MPKTLESMESVLKKHFKPVILRVSDDSEKHAGHSGNTGYGVTHVRIYLISSLFEGLTKVARHREVYRILQPFMNKGLHAAVLNLFSPNEIQAMTLDGQKSEIAHSPQ